MRTTVLRLALTTAILGGTLAARADDAPFLVAGQSPEAWQETGDGAGPEPYSDISPDAPSWIRPRYWFIPPKFGTYFQADVLYLERINNASNQPITVNNQLGGVVVMDSDAASLAHKWTPAMMFTLGFNLDQIGQVEATYWGLNTTKNSSTVSGVDQFFNTGLGSLGLAGTLQTTTSDYQIVDRMTIDYVSRINNVELNYKQTINGVTLLAGPRYFRMVETFNINSQTNANIPTLPPTASDYNVSTVNNLIGIQAGLGYTYEGGPLNIGVLGKIGPYMNAVHQTTYMQDFGNTVVVSGRDYNKDGMPVSTLGELQANVSYRFTDWFSIHAGYRFLWIQNVAFAPDQLDLNISPPGEQVLNPHSHLLMQGASAGAEIRW